MYKWIVIVSGCDQETDFLIQMINVFVGRCSKKRDGVQCVQTEMEEILKKLMTIPRGPEFRPRIIYIVCFSDR